MMSQRAEYVLRGVVYLAGRHADRLREFCKGHSNLPNTTIFMPRLGRSQYHDIIFVVISLKPETQSAAHAYRCSVFLGVF